MARTRISGLPKGVFSSMISFMNQYTAAIQKDGDFWIGWIEEVPGVNSQGNTREELLENLQSALKEALEMNRQEAQQAAGEHFEEIHISA
jgi:predicted RNase H-like HicB family nuclease